MNSEEARNYFKEGLCYEDITEGDICVLVMLLNKHIKQAVKAKTMSTDSMRMSQKLDSKYRRNGTLKSCYLYINSHYFTQREFIITGRYGDLRDYKEIWAYSREGCEKIRQKAKKIGFITTVDYPYSFREWRKAI